MRALVRLSLAVTLGASALAACSGGADTNFFAGTTSSSSTASSTTSSSGTTSSSTSSSGTGGAGMGGGGQGGGGGCKVDGDCSDAIPCTLDACVAGACAHQAGPTVGPTACPPKQFCDVLKGCVPGVACADTAQCVAKFGGDACNTNIVCDQAMSVCTYQTLDKDKDGHPPIICGGGDCDDSDPTIHPGAADVCDGKDNDCNGKIDDGATCGGLEACQGGACVCPLQNTCGALCVDLTKDPAHCGACATQCDPAASCVASKCVCPANATNCAGVCVDLKKDPNNCNACGKQCPASSTCSAGACVCNAPLALCGGACVDTKTDPNNCSACGVTCNGVCQAGVCNPCPASDLFLMQDVSGSTSTAAVGGTRLDVARFAIANFMAEAKSSGLGLGIGYHPLIPPVPPTCMVNADCGPTGTCFNGVCFAGSDSCTASDYAVPAIPIALLPGVSAAIIGSLNAQMSNGGSPVATALEGGLMYAKSYALAHPTHKVAMVLITDGTPNECTPNVTDEGDLLPIASQYAAGAPMILTYIIGLGTGAVGDVTQAQLDAVAQAGGTGTGHLANSTAEVQTSLEQIRDSIKLCP